MPRNKNETPEETKKSIQTQALQETEILAKKQRFGLFSYPTPLCIGEDTIGEKTIPARDSNGKVITMARNFQISPPKAGMVKSSFFSDMSYITIGDKYLDPGRLDRLKQLETNKKKPADQPLFKPSDFYKTLVSSTYKHETDFKEQKKTYRNSEGKVITAPFNIVTGPRFNPLYKSLPHMEEDYESMKKLKTKERLMHQEKLKDHPPFKIMEHGNKAFVKDSKTYGLDKPLPDKKPRKETKLNIINHEAPFKPSNPPKKGYNKSIGKFPAYKENPLKWITRKPNQPKKDPFKIVVAGTLSRPSPSIAANLVNIKHDMSA